MSEECRTRKTLWFEEKKPPLIQQNLELKLELYNYWKQNFKFYVFFYSY